MSALSGCKLWPKHWAHEWSAHIVMGLKTKTTYKHSANDDGIGVT